MYCHSPEQAAAAADFARELQEYQAQLRELLLRRWDPELYRSLSDQFDRMQMLAELLPRLSVTWTELLITRAELTHALWSRTAPSRINGRVVACHEQHAAVLQKALRECGEYMARLPSSS
ncbi:MAG: hypothetical protein EOO30_18665 [Comamonadaceae bacterium]|nr:MAG: hypothetical protein EOO30_18665 [Comamonadaceae bacterium]